MVLICIYLEDDPPASRLAVGKANLEYWRLCIVSTNSRLEDEPCQNHFGNTRTELGQNHSPTAIKTIPTVVVRENHEEQRHDHPRGSVQDDRLGTRGTMEGDETS